jgi:hypothetical protein
MQNNGAVAENTYVKPKRKRYKLSFAKKEGVYNEHDGQYLHFYPAFGRLCFKVSPSTYFDDRPQLNVHLTTLIALIGFGIQFTGILPIWSLFIWAVLFLVPFGQIFLSFPLHSGICECEYPSYGFCLYKEDDRGLFNSFMGNWGMKTYILDMPWHWAWIRTSNLRKDGTWEHETKGNNKDFWEDKWKEVIWNESHPYTYKLNSGEIQERIATIKVAEREWRWKGLKWSSFPKMISKTINIDFNAEVGERTGSWKGGCTGCSYTILPGETPLQTLRRMESERKFK